MFWVGVIAFILAMAAIWCGVPLAVIAVDSWHPSQLVGAYLLTGLLTGAWGAYMFGREPGNYGNDPTGKALAVLVLVFIWPWAWFMVIAGFWKRWNERRK